MNSLQGTVNTAILIGYSENAAAAVGAANTVINVILLFGTVIAMGSTIVISNSIGAENIKKASEISFTAILVSIFFAFVITPVMLLASGGILRQMNLDGEIYENALIYFRIRLCFFAVQSAMSVLLALLKCYGYPKYTFLIGLLTNAINLLLNIYVIHFPQISPVTGVSGVALACCCANIIGLIATIVIIKNTGIKLKKPCKIKTVLNDAGGILKLGIPSGLSSVSFTLSQMITTSFVALLGDSALSAKVYFTNILSYVYLFSFSAGSANALLIKTAGLDCYYGSANWHLAFGVNNFTSYYSFEGLTNEDIQKLNRHIARCGEILRWGKRDSRTAIFYPEPDMWSVCSVDVHDREWRGEKFKPITQNFNALTWELLHKQTDFDYVDGELIKNAKIENGVLCYNDRRYTDIIFSVLNVVEDKVAKKIIEMADAGIRVYILDGTGEISRETGEKSPYADKLSELLNSGVVNGNNNGDILKMLGNNFRGNIIKTDKYQTKLLTHCRITEDGTRVIFAANMGYDKLCDNITVCGRYAKLYDIKPEDGTFTEHDLRSAGSETMFHISLDGIKAHIYVLEE